jgi:hypothetical protein
MSLLPEYDVKSRSNTSDNQSTDFESIAGREQISINFYGLWMIFAFALDQTDYDHQCRQNQEDIPHPIDEWKQWKYLLQYHRKWYTQTCAY